MHEATGDVLLSIVPVVLTVGKVLATIFIVGLATGISYTLLVLALWYHLLLHRALVALFIYGSILLCLAGWYTVGKILKRIWRRQP